MAAKETITTLILNKRNKVSFFFFFYNDPATTEFSPLPLHDALPIWVNLTAGNSAWDAQPVFLANGDLAWLAQERPGFESDRFHIVLKDAHTGAVRSLTGGWDRTDRKSTRLNSSHSQISYAVFCLTKK